MWRCGEYTAEYTGQSERTVGGGTVPRLVEKLVLAICC